LPERVLRQHRRDATRIEGLELARRAGRGLDVDAEEVGVDHLGHPFLPDASADVEGFPEQLVTHDTRRRRCRAAMAATKIRECSSGLGIRWWHRLGHSDAEATQASAVVGQDLVVGLAQIEVAVLRRRMKRGLERRNPLLERRSGGSWERPPRRGDDGHRRVVLWQVQLTGEPAAQLAELIDQHARGVTRLVSIVTSPHHRAR
jgi:hypothetical protein